MPKKTKKNRYCFLDKTRLCTLDCRAAYEIDIEVFCGIIWSIQSFGYAMDSKEKTMKAQMKTVKKKQAKKKEKK